VSARGFDLFLGLDFGTESVRALVVDGCGRVAGSASAPYPHGQIVAGSATAQARFDQPLPRSWALQDPDDWLDAVVAAVRAAGRETDLGRVVSIGVDFTSCTVVPARRDGTPLSRTVWMDHPHAWPKLWKHHGAGPQADRLTALAVARDEPWLARYGGIIGLEWFFPKVLEVIEQDPEVAAATEVWLEGGDWLVWQLSGAPSWGGEREADHLIRSTCQAGYKGLWSRADGFPSRDYLDSADPALGAAAADKLPGCFLAPGQRAGSLVPEAAVRLGLTPGIAVSTAVIDAHAGVPGAGVSDVGTLVMVLGTSGCHMLMAEEEHLVPGVAGVVGDGILPGFFGYETGQAAVGDAFEWVRRLCGAPAHAELEHAARAVASGADGLCAVDWFNGCRTPLMDGGLRGALLGLDLQHGPAHLYRAVLEASACGVAWIVDTLRDGGAPIERFVATGGLPRENALFLEILASVLGAPIEVPPVVEGPAMGAAVLGALASGRFISAEDAIASMVGSRSALPPARVVPPDLVSPEQARGLRRRYGEAVSLCSDSPSVRGAHQ